VLGTTLFSLTNEWQQRLYTLEEMFAKLAELGLGPAVEVVGFQSFRDFPDVSDETASHFRDLLEKYDLIPSCLGGNSDIGRRKHRLMTHDERLDYINRQIVSTAKMGFPVYRYQPGAGIDVMEELVPTAEKYGVQLACELHSPLAVDHPEVVAFREMYDRVNSPFLGFIPDFSTSMRSIPEGYWGNLRRAGGTEELIEAVKEVWYTDKSIPEKFGALQEAGARLGAGPAVMGQLNTVMTMFGHMPVEKWVELLPYARHIHGKFYHVDESGHEPSIPYDEIMALLKRTGYSGTISAEWEGQAFTEEPIGFQEVQGWHAMCSRLLAASEAAIS
jgi:sugar phosphate isomerase/epimerase